MKRIWKFFCSVKLTIVLFVLILIPSVIGTVVQQNVQDPNFVPNPLYNFLGFYDIYHDPRFIILLVMLGLNTFACTVNRFRPKWNMIGMLMTHTGLLLILMGAVVGATLGVKGSMTIREGETLDKILVGWEKTGISQPVPIFESIPFKVHLVDFILDKHEEPEHRLIVFDMKTGKPKSLQLEEGQAVPLVEPRWSGVMSLFGIRPKSNITVQPTRFIESAAISTTLSEGPEQTGIKAVEVRLRNNSGMELRGYTVAGSPSPYTPRGTHVGIFYALLDSSSAIESRLQNDVAETKATNRIDAVMPETGLTTTHSAQVGSTFEIEGHKIEVLRYVPDFVMAPGRQVTTRSESPNNPAIQVRVTKPDGTSSEQWLFALHQGMHMAEELPFELKFTRSGPEGSVVDNVFIYNSPDGRPVAAQARDGKLLKRGEIEPEKPFAIDGTGFDLVIEKFYENMNRNSKLIELKDGQGRPAAEVSIHSGGTQQDLVLWLETPVDIPGYRLIYVEEERIRDFYSILQILQGDKVVAEKKIEVNDPLRYGGYTFYQSSYDDKAESWSGLQVRKDPGVPLVYGGFLVQILGMIVIFYINPVIRKAKKSKADE